MQQIYDWTPRQLANFEIGWRTRFDQEQQRAWERSRFTAMIVVNPKNYQKFPWEKVSIDKLRELVKKGNMPQTLPDWAKKNEGVK